MDMFQKMLDKFITGKKIKTKSSGERNKNINMSNHNFSWDSMRKNGKVVGSNKKRHNYDTHLNFNIYSNKDI